jgi:hypothetical protein
LDRRVLVSKAASLAQGSIEDLAEIEQAQANVLDDIFRVYAAWHGSRGAACSLAARNRQAAGLDHGEFERRR